MNTTDFLAAYHANRNGTETFTRHPLVRNFAMSDGVREIADAGCWWLFDILATELPAKMRKASAASAMVETRVAKGKAHITAEFIDGQVDWARKIDYTDLPDGSWKVYITNDGYAFMCILISEY